MTDKENRPPVSPKVAEARRRAALQGDPLRLTATAKERARAAAERAAMTAAPKARAADVPDPYNPGKTERVRRADQNYIDWLFANGKIEPVERDACDVFAAMWQEAQVSPARAIDYGKVRVDGGSAGADPVAAAMAAVAALQRIRAALGPRHYAMLVMVAAEGLNATEAAIAYKAGIWRRIENIETIAAFRAGLGGTDGNDFSTPWGTVALTRADRDTGGRVLREAIADLCAYWGWGAEAHGPAGTRIRAEGADALARDFSAFREGIVVTDWAAGEAERRRKRRK